MSEKDFRGQLSEVRQMGLAPARPFNIDLSIVKADHELNVSGNFFYIKDAPGLTEYIEVKVNSSGQTAVRWSKQTGFIQPFNRLYITTPSGQTGTMTILIASESPSLFDVIDNRSAISDTMQGVLDELRGDTTPENWGTEKTVNSGAATQILAANTNRKSCSIQAKSTNSGRVYIGYDNSVTSTKWKAELQAGQLFSTDDYRGALYARADVNGQKVGYGEH